MRLRIAPASVGLLMSVFLAIPSTTVANNSYGNHGYGDRKYKKKPNIIVILADDYGQVSAQPYVPKTADPDFPKAAPVPNLINLAKQGVLFKNGWAMPVCSTTRGTRTLGKLPTTTGIGGPLGGNDNYPTADPDDPTKFPAIMLNPFDPNTVQRLAQKKGYHTIKVGKWHEVGLPFFGPRPVTDPTINGPGVTDAIRSGFDVFYGQLPGFPTDGYGGSVGGSGADTWTPASNLDEYNLIPTDEYLTSALVSRAKEFIWKTKKDRKPYYLALDFAAPHWPYEVAPGPLEPVPDNFKGKKSDWLRLDPYIHRDVIIQVIAAWNPELNIDDIRKDLKGHLKYYPPAGTQAPFDPPGPGPAPDPNQVQSRAAFKSMISYMDLQIGRLLKHVDMKHTNVFFIGDNGTQGGGGANNPASGNNVTEAPFDPLKQKSSVWRGGPEVPFIVAGQAVRHKGRYSDAMVTSTDVYATVLDMIGQKQPYDTRNDSISFQRVLKGYKGQRRYAVAEWFGKYASVGGTQGVQANEGRVVGNQHFRLQARPVIELVSANPNIYRYVCGDKVLPLTPECLDDNGIYQKKYFVTFYDLRNDPFETKGLVLDEMTRKQKRNFYRLCKHMNAVARKATYIMNADKDLKLCEPDGSNLQTEQTNPL